MSEIEKIWLIDTGEPSRVWCDSPDPSWGIDPEDVTGPYILNADQRIAELEAEMVRMQELEIRRGKYCILLEKDAERYRWLCSDNSRFVYSGSFFGDTKKEIDAAIDEAMREGEG